MFIKKIQSKIKTWPSATETADQCRKAGGKVVFTNGCFDLIHYGHIHYLAQAKDLGDCLIVGVNADLSVSKLKGPHRPIKDENTRLLVLAAFEFVNVAVLFEQDTPYELIQTLRPDVLVKGGDWSPEQIIGADLVLAQGGRVLSLPFVEGFSTSNYERKIRGK